jgi:hypothetical protein
MFSDLHIMVRGRLEIPIHAHWTFISLDQQTFPEVAATSLPGIGKGGCLVSGTKPTRVLFHILLHRLNPSAITASG